MRPGDMCNMAALTESSGSCVCTVGGAQRPLIAPLASQSPPLFGPASMHAHTTPCAVQPPEQDGAVAIGKQHTTWQ